MNGSFAVPGGELTAAVRYAAQALDAKPTIPAHGGLLFEIDYDHLYVTGHGENATAKAVVPINVENPFAGSFLVAGRLITRLLDTFPDTAVTFEHCDGAAAVAMSAGRFRTTLPAMPVKDFPTVPVTAEPVGTVDGAVLADAVKRVVPACKRDTDSGAALCCVHLQLGDSAGGPLVVMGTNRYQAARQTLNWEPAEEAPHGAVLVLAPVLADAVDAFAGGPVELGWQDGTFSLSSPARTLVTRTHNVAEFPADQLNTGFATEMTAAVTVRTKDLTLPLKRAVLLEKDRDFKTIPTITVRLSKGVATLSVGVGGDSDEQVDVTYDGPDAAMTFRAELLLAALGSAPSDTPTMHFIPDTYRPVIVSPGPDSSWRHLLMPIRPLGGTS